MNGARAALPCLALLAGAALGQHTLAGVVREADRSPVAGAAVAVRWRVHPELPGLAGWTLGDDGAASAAARTDDAGRWRLELPVAGPFAVVASGAGEHGELLAPLAFPVMAGDFVEQVLAEPTRIGGQVRDGDGAPRADFEVCCEPQQTTWTRLAVYGMPLVRLAARTGADGRFALVWPNAYLRAPFWEPFLVPRPADPRWRFAQEPLLRPTRACRELDLIAVPATTTTGGVRDHEGAALAAATVFLRAAPWRAVAAAADGSYAIAARGPAELGAVAAGHAPSFAPKVRRVGDALAGDFALPKAANVRARLHGADGAPLAGCAVLWSLVPGDLPPLEHTATTDAGGRVEFAGCGAGQAVWGFVEHGGVYRRFARVAPTGDVDLGDVRVVRRTLRGLVVGPSQAPLPGARIVVREASAPGAPPAVECLWVTYANHGGRFELPALPPGRLVVMAECSAHGFTSAEVADGQDDVRLATSAKGVLEFEVRDADGAPVPSAWITLTGGGGAARGLAPAPALTSSAIAALADANGRVRFAGLPEGSWQVIANVIRDGQMASGSTVVATGADPVLLQLRPVAE